MKRFITLVGIILLASCSKDDILVEFEEQIQQSKQDTSVVDVVATTPTTNTSFINNNRNFPLYKESILNQRSGISFTWDDQSSEHHEYTSIMDLYINGGGWYGQGQSYADVNKDGYQDILVSYSERESGMPRLAWYINQGDNLHFNYSVDLFNKSTEGYRAHKILKTDVNNDNIADYVALGVDERVAGDYSGNFTVLIGKSDGTFDVNNIPNPNKYWFHNGAAGDLNGDGFVDVVSATYIWWGDGNGNFVNSNISVEQYTMALVYEILDMNSDGFNDLILRGPNQNTTIVLNDNGNFTSTNKTHILPNVQYKAVMDIEILDFDNDGDYDIIELAQLGGNPPDSWDPKYNVSNITVYYNNNMEFTPDETLLSDSIDGNYLNGQYDKYGWSVFKFDDIDGDGQDEIIAENYQDGTYNGLKKVNGEWKKTTILFGN